MKKQVEQKRLSRWRRPSRYHPLRKLRIALDGMRRAILLDFSVRYKVVISVGMLFIAASYETLFHFLFMLAVTGFMLATEVLNTAIESLCDYVQPAADDRIKGIKDVAAASALIGITVWYVVIAIVLYEFALTRELFGGASVR